MNNPRRCPKCGTVFPKHSPGDLCGSCLMRLGVDAVAGSGGTTIQDFGAVIHRQASAVGIQFYGLGDYELEGELARGGMGMVFRAWQGKLQRHVAIKLMLPDQLDSTGRVRRFQLEAEATARLDHPNIVPIHEIGEVNGHHFLCMKLIQGETLGHALAKGRFERRSACVFMVTLAEAIHYAHQRGVLHRDLKPGNILVDEHGQPQVTDFGLARLLEGNQELTRPDAVLGTPGYMSPEQAAGRSRDLTIACDIHALGAILYEMLTGRPPFRAESILETLRQVRECEPVPPRRIDPAIPLDLDTICRKCLNKEPKARYATAQALADDLRRYLRGEPVMARPLTPLARTGRWCRRNTGITALLAGVLTLLVLFTGAALFERQQVLPVKHSLARLVADSMELDLANIGKRAEEEALRLAPRLGATRNELDSFSYTNDLQQIWKDSQVLTNSWATIVNWVLMDGRGHTLGRWPEVNPELKIQDRSARDYFLGAIKQHLRTGSTRYYLSAAYDSKEDGLRKIGISVVVPGATSAEPLGVLTAMVLTRPKALADAFLIHNHELVLVSAIDPSTNPGRISSKESAVEKGWSILLHPLDDEFGTNYFLFPSHWVTRTNLTFYLDPGRHSRPAEAWMPWIAGLAPVRDHGTDLERRFIVVVQSRDWISMFLIPGLILSAFGLGIAGWRTWRAERRAAMGHG